MRGAVLHGQAPVSPAVRQSPPLFIRQLPAVSRPGGGWFDLPQKFFPSPLDKSVYGVYTVHIVYIQNINEVHHGHHHQQFLYEQIVRQMKGLILSGQLSEDEALPSMRLLARDLRISVITTKRAYEELEREGFLATVPGKGCFVAAQNRETRREAVLCQIEEHLSQAVDAARAGAVDLDELTEMLNTLYSEGEL